MYKNISRKIKTVAKILGLISILGFAYVLLILIVAPGSGEDVPMLVAVCALFAVLFIFSFPIYGIGKLIDEAKTISKALKSKEIQTESNEREDLK